MNIWDDAIGPLDVALIANKQAQDTCEQEGRDCSDYHFEIDRNLQRIAGEYARKRDFKLALKVCMEIRSDFMLIRTIMDIACEMLKAGEEDGALKTINLAWENSQEPVNGFPEENLLPYLDTVRSFGHEKLVTSILEFALVRAEMTEDGNFRLKCFCKLLPYLAIHLQVEAEKIIDHILSLPTGNPERRDEFLHPDMEVLIDIAIAINKYDLVWNDERRRLFHKSLEFSQQLTHKKIGGNKFRLIDEVNKLITERSSMKIGLSDFQTFLLASRGTVFIGKGRAFGDDEKRAIGALNMALKIMSHSVCDDQKIVSAIVLIGDAAGSITLGEYQAVVDNLNSIISEDTELLAAFINDETLGEDVEVTVLLEKVSKGERGVK